MGRRKRLKVESGRGRDRMLRWMELVDSGMGIEEACSELGVRVSEIADWLEDEEFCEFWEKWRLGMQVVVEGRLAERAKKGSIAGAVKYLMSLEPERWSEKLIVHSYGHDEREVRIVFNWQPSDRQVGGVEEGMIVGRVDRVLPGGDDSGS